MPPAYPQSAPTPSAQNASRAAAPIPISQRPLQPAPNPGPIAPEHIAAINAAKLRSKKIRRAANVALFSGSTLAFFAVCTFLGVLFGDVVSLILGIALAVSAACELYGGSLLRRFNPVGAQWLGWNQIALAIMICVYAAWSLYASLHSPALAGLDGSTGDAHLDNLASQIKFIASWGVYGSLAFFGLLGPGLTAWYYFSRAKYVRELLAGTPDWVIQTLNAAA
ncbi:MAG TPA: hypothetical protein VG711_04865 [Phycisphaerales bacterium]|nr:hypothetical protein [Phycisphaerales bacterium]